jgi:hypothetical protein
MAKYRETPRDFQGSLAKLNGRPEERSHLIGPIAHGHIHVGPH